MSMKKTLKNVMRKACCLLLIAATVLTCAPLVFSADPTPVTKEATLAWTLTNLYHSVVVQNFYIAEDYIYISQRAKTATINGTACTGVTYITRLQKNSDGTATPVDKMTLRDCGAGETLDFYNYNGEAYILVGVNDLKPSEAYNKNDSYYSSQIARIKYAPDVNGVPVYNTYTDFCRWSSMDKATQTAYDDGTIVRVVAAAGGNYILFRIELYDSSTEKRHVRYSLYKTNELNQALDAKMNSSSKYVGMETFYNSTAKENVAYQKSFTQSSAEGNYVHPQGSFQGMEISSRDSIYVSGGNSFAEDEVTPEKPQIAMMDKSGNYLKLITINNWHNKPCQPEMQGLQAEQGLLYFAVSVDTDEDGKIEDSEKKTGQQIYYLEESEFGINHVLLKKAGTRSCEGEGTNTLVFCRECGFNQSVQITMPGRGHNYVTVPQTNATCTTYGKTAGSYCTKCGTWQTTQTDIPPTGHNYGAGTVTQAATCTTVGIRTFTCSKCSDSYTEEIEKLLHKDSNNDSICDVCSCSTDAEPQNIVLDYAKTIESNIIEKAIINGVPDEHLRSAKLVSVTPAVSVDSSLYTSAIFDSNGDGVTDSLRFSLKMILQKVLRLNCKISFKGPDGASYERIIPVNIVPATSVYYETDAADGMFNMTTTGSAWSVVGSPSSTKQDSGDNEVAVSDLAYNFQNIPSGAFYTDFNGGDDRYKKDYVYAGLNYDSQSNWSFDATRLSGWAVDPVLGTLTLTRKQANYTNFWFQSGGDSQRNYNLNYIPKDNHYAIIRLKFTSAAFTDSVSPKVDLRYYTAADKTEGGAYTDHTEPAGESSIPKEYLTNGEYVTIKFKLNFNESYLRERVTAFRWGISGLQNGQGSASNSVTIDYLYVGPLEGIESLEGSPADWEDSEPFIAPEYYEAPAYSYNDYLLFDFDNSPEAQKRYNNTAYKNYTDYDTASHWTALYDNNSTDGKYENVKREGKDVTVDNEKGTLTVPVAVQQSNAGRYGSYFAPTDGTHQLISFTDVGTDKTIYECLNFKPKSNTNYYFHIRFKITGCKKDDVMQPISDSSDLFIQFSCMDQSTKTWTFNTASTRNGGEATYELELDKYITVSNNVTAQVKNCTNIIGLYFRFANLMRSGSSNGKIEIDYIYLGPEKDPTKIRSPKQENVMIDFDNGDYDKNRYAGQLYGGVNFDSKGGWGNTYWFEPSFENSIMTLTPQSTAINGAVGLPRISPQGNIAHLDYKMTGKDYIVLRMKTNNIRANGGELLRLYFGESERVIYTEGIVEDTELDLSGKWKDYIFDISSYANQYDTIRYFFLEFENFVFTGNSSIEIEFIYLGSLENGSLPAEALYFGFGNRLEDQQRYDSLTYRNLNFDEAENWVDRLEYLESISISNDLGVMEIVPKSGVNRFAVDTGYGNTPPLNFPLNFHPENVEICQIRFKMENFSPSTDGSKPYFRFQYFYDNVNDAALTENQYFPVRYLSNGEYITLTIDLRNDPIVNVAQIPRVRMYFVNFVANANSKLTVDYLYVGPGDPIDGNEMTYGYDSGYDSDLLYSGGSSYFVEGAGVPGVVEDSKGNKYINYDACSSYTEASFTFTGTGFDIISRTGVEQGALRIVVCDQNGYAVKTVSVLNKGIKELYQIPVASVEMRDEITKELIHGTYTVHIFANAAFDFGDDGNEDMFGGELDRGGQFYLDAIRIYNTINTAAGTDDAKTAYVVYQQHGEADPTIVEIRQKLIDASKDTSSKEMDGVVYLDTKDEGTSQIAAYEDAGPNNEVYLAPGNAIGFKLEASGSVPASIDIGAKSADGSPVTMRASIAGVQTDTAISTNTAQYYPLHIAANQWQSENGKNYVTVRITNSGTNGILSITDVKYAYDIPAEDSAVSPTGESRSLRFLVDKDVLPPVEEDDVDGGISIGETLTLESDLTMNFRIKTEQLAAYDLSTAYLVVERDVYNSDGTVEVETRTLTEYTVKDNRLVFAYTGISAAQMNDEIRAVLYIKDASGKEYVSNEKVTSVAIYSDLMLGASAGNEKLITLIMDMLNYGTAAQVYFNRHADAPVNEAFESFKTYASYASSDLKAALEDMSGTISNGNASATVTQGLDLSTRVGITYKVKLPAGVDAADATLVVKDAYGNELESFDLSSGTVDSKGRYVVTFFGSTSREMRRMVYATVMVDGAAISDTYTYTISSYAHTIANTAGMPEALVNLTRLMVIYGDSADAYFA